MEIPAAEMGTVKKVIPLCGGTIKEIMRAAATLSLLVSLMGRDSAIESIFKRGQAYYQTVAFGASAKDPNKTA